MTKPERLLQLRSAVVRVIVGCEGLKFRNVVVCVRALLRSDTEYVEPTEREIDRALQFCRRVGLIRFDSKTGWHITPAVRVKPV